MQKACRQCKRRCKLTSNDLVEQVLVIVAFNSMNIVCRSKVDLSKVALRRKRKIFLPDEIDARRWKEAVGEATQGSHNGKSWNIFLATFQRTPKGQETTNSALLDDGPQDYEHSWASATRYLERLEHLQKQDRVWVAMRLSQSLSLARPTAAGRIQAKVRTVSEGDANRLEGVFRVER